VRKQDWLRFDILVRNTLFKGALPGMNDSYILIVEDDPVALFVTQKQLAKLGYSCQTASSGEEALTKYCPDVSLIFMDIGLPGIDGIEAAVRIRDRERRESLPRVPIVALTAHSNKDDCLAAGMNEHLQKPATLADIQRVCEFWLAQKSEVNRI
jgi:CheY-like chemotaxis protein